MGEKKRRRENRKREFEDLSVKKDKIPAGAYIRSAKIAPLRPAILQKVLAMLSESGIPLKLRMPTEQICTKFEELSTLFACTIDLKKALV